MDHLTRLFDRYYDRLYAYAYRRLGSRPDAEDAAAAAFLAAVRRPPPRGDTEALAWLYTVTRRRVVDTLRRRGRAAFLDVPLNCAADPAEVMDLNRALGRLRPADRKVIELHYFAGLSHAEAGAVLGCTANAAAVRLHRALTRLKRSGNVSSP